MKTIHYISRHEITSAKNQILTFLSSYESSHHKFNCILNHLASSCALPSAPEHGWIKTEAEQTTFLVEEQFYTYGCDPGYCRFGNSKVYCYQTGWSHVASCKREYR